MPDQPDKPGVAVLPPLLFIVGLLIALALHFWIWPLSIPASPVVFAVGVVIGALGIGLAAWGRITLVKAGTNVSPLKPSTTIVSRGPYRFTRNPLYLGAASLLLGISVCLGTWWGLVILVPIFLVLHYGVILREERYLERKFGESYAQYRSTVRRYL